MNYAEGVVLTAFDDEPPPASSPATPHLQQRSLLAFDIGLFDSRTASFLVVHAAGTPLDGLKARTVSVPAGQTESPLTALTLYARSSTESQPMPFLTLPCHQDIRGRQLTLRFADPADPRSL